MRRWLAAAVLALFCGGLLACRGGAAHPSEVDARNDACRSCRMPVSDPRLAAQIAAPGEDAIFFDDLGCLRDWLARGPALPSGAVAFVADHRQGNWTRAAGARFFRCPSVDTPMGSHLIAQGGDGAPAECTAVSTAEIFGAGGPPGGGP